MADVGQDLLNVPFPEMVQKLAAAIAEGQYQLDRRSAEITRMMGKTGAMDGGGEKWGVMLPKLDKPEEEEEISLLAAGFTPTFYQFTDTIIEVKMAISMTKSRETSASVSAKGGWACFSASVNASYSSKYSYSVEGSSLLRTKITPVPSPAVLQRRIEGLVAKQLGVP